MTTSFAFVGILAATLASWVLVLGRVGKTAPPEGAAGTDRNSIILRFLAGVAVWGAATGAAEAIGLFASPTKAPPTFVLLPAGAAVGLVVLDRSRVGRALRDTPLAAAIALAWFRFPLELLMHYAVLHPTEGAVLPPQMTFGTGYNYDIVIGISSIFVAVAYQMGKISKGVVRAWNVAGCLALAVVAVLGVTSHPFFALFGSEPSVQNTWILHAPFVWLPGILVPAALYGHILVFRGLRQSTG